MKKHRKFNMNGYVYFMMDEDGRPCYKHPTKRRYYQDEDGSTFYKGCK